MKTTKQLKPVSAAQLRLLLGWMGVACIVFIIIALVRGDAWELLITVAMLALGGMIVSTATVTHGKQNEEDVLADLRRRKAEQEKTVKNE